MSPVTDELLYNTWNSIYEDIKQRQAANSHILKAGGRKCFFVLLVSVCSVVSDTRGSLMMRSGDFSSPALYFWLDYLDIMGRNTKL